MSIVEFDIAEGYGHSDMLQAAHIVLHFAKIRDVRVDFKDINGVWRHFLSGRDQLALRKLEIKKKNAPALDTQWTPAEKNVQICIRPANAIPSFSRKNAWLILLGESEGQHAIDDENWLGVIRIRKNTSSVDNNLEIQSGACSLFSAEPTEHGDATLVIGTGSFGRDQKCFEDAANKIKKKIIFFDVYEQHSPGMDLEKWKGATCTIVHPCSDKQRLSMYAKCQRVIADDALVHENNLFLTEALQNGVALACIDRQKHDLGAYGHNARDFSSVVRDLEAIIWRKDGHHSQPTQIGRITLSPYATFERVVVHDKPEHTVAWIAAGKAERFDANTQAWLQNANYDAILVDTSNNALLVSPIFTHFLQKKMREPNWKMPDIEICDSRDAIEKTILEVAKKNPFLKIDFICAGLPLQELKLCYEILHSVHERLDKHPKIAKESIQQKKSVWVESLTSFYDADVNAGEIGIRVATNSIFGGLYRVPKKSYELTRIFQGNALDSGGRIYYYPNYGELGFISSRTYDFGALEGLLKNQPPDMLLISGCVLLSQLIARQAWSTRNYPIVGFLHSLHITTLVSGLMRELLTNGFYRGDLYISPSQCGKIAMRKALDAAREQLKESTGKDFVYPGDIEVVPYGLDLSIYDNQNKIACRQTLALPKERRIILSVGRFAKEQKFDLLPVLIAMQHLIEQGCKPYLVLLGTFQEKHTIRSLQRSIDRLKLTEHVEIVLGASVEEKKMYYGAADIFVSPSDNIQETYGLTIIEAMAAGLPVVASAWDGYREIVEHEKTGLLVPVTWGKVPEDRILSLMVAEGFVGHIQRDLYQSVAIDVAKLAHYLRMLVENTELAREMGKYGRKRADLHYEIRKQSKKVGDILVDRMHAFSEPKKMHPIEKTMFFDNISSRFEHFTAHHLLETTVIELSEAAHDISWVKIIIEEAQIAFLAEERKILSLVDILRSGPKQVHELTAMGMDTLRILRCLKYNIVRIAR